MSGVSKKRMLEAHISAIITQYEVDNNEVVEEVRLEHMTDKRTGKRITADVGIETGSPLLKKTEKETKNMLRNITRKERMIEVIRSMPQPEMKISTFNEHGEDGGVPELTVKAKNQNGYMDYKYQHSGLIGLQEAKAEFESLQEEILNKNKVEEKPSKELLEKSKKVFQLAPMVSKREQDITNAIMEETKIKNLSHYQEPIISRELAILTKEQEQQIKDNGDGNVYGGDRFIGQTVFGEEDKFEPIEEYIDRIKSSDIYKFFVEKVGSKIEEETNLSTHQAFHDFSDKFKTVEDIKTALGKNIVSLLTDDENQAGEPGMKQ